MIAGLKKKKIIIFSQSISFQHSELFLDKDKVKIHDQVEVI